MSSFPCLELGADADRLQNVSPADSEPGKLKIFNRLQAIEAEAPARHLPDRSFTPLTSSHSQKNSARSTFDAMRSPSLHRSNRPPCSKHSVWTYWANFPSTERLLGCQTNWNFRRHVMEPSRMRTPVARCSEYRAGPEISLI